VDPNPNKNFVDPTPMKTFRIHDTDMEPVLLYWRLLDYTPGVYIFSENDIPPPFELYIFSPFRNIMRDVKFDVVIP
jgi:hypothetical protein